MSAVRLGLVASSLLLAALSAPAAAQPMPGMADGFPSTIAGWSKGAKLFTGLGGFHRPVGTASPKAQAYFDQGMRLLWAFNHDEAARSFARATWLDPACAMCFWGVALTLGPNYNMPMMAGVRAATGWQALQRAQVLAKLAKPVDRALIAALARRFDGATALTPANSGPLLRAYADAMRGVARNFPDDLDARVMFAEAVMNLNPWKLWAADGTPAPGTQEIVDTLQAVLAKAPNHPGANHYYIHAVEASRDPGRALPSAGRIGAAMPAAGHLVHMPSHILHRVGRYAESAEANRRAAVADDNYYRATAAIDYYPMYSAHNYQFLAASAAMTGRAADTVSALRAARKILSDDMVVAMPGLDWTVAFLYDALIRFGMWDAMLAEPAPDRRLGGMVIDYHASRAQALAAKGRIDAARADLALAESALAVVPSDAAAGMNAGQPLYAIAILRAKARIATATGDPAAAVAALTEAVAIEDALSYNEPADMFFPTRHLLGAALLGVKQPAAAERVYREDLQRNPANGWALYGLAVALDRQDRRQEAAGVRQQFVKVWPEGAAKIDGSAF